MFGQPERLHVIGGRVVHGQRGSELFAVVRAGRVVVVFGSAAAVPVIQMPFAARRPGAVVLAGAIGVGRAIVAARQRRGFGTGFGT